VIGPTDPGTAERLEFAWHRSGLAFAGIGLAIVRRSLPYVAARPTLGAVLITVGVTLTLAAVVWRAVAYQPRTRRAQLRLATGGALLIGVIALIAGVAA
jgi:uncharacterized membrane protein YidH (DUF202 family)